MANEADLIDAVATIGAYDQMAGEDANEPAARWQLDREAVVRMARELATVVPQEGVAVRSRDGEHMTLVTTYSSSRSRDGDRLALNRTTEDEQERYGRWSDGFVDPTLPHVWRRVRRVVDLTVVPDERDIEQWDSAAMAFVAELPEAIPVLTGALTHEIETYTRAAGRPVLVNRAGKSADPSSATAPHQVAFEPAALEAAEGLVLATIDGLRDLKAARDSALQELREASTETASFLRRNYPELVREADLDICEQKAVYRPLFSPFGRRVDVPVVTINGAAVEAPPLRRFERLTQGWDVDPQAATQFLTEIGPRLSALAEARHALRQGKGLPAHRPVAAVHASPTFPPLSPAPVPPTAAASVRPAAQHDAGLS